MKANECPNYQSPNYFVDLKTDKGYEGSAWCKLTDHACDLEYSGKCEESETIELEMIKERAEAAQTNLWWTLHPVGELLKEKLSG
jgi:hypothetical protein